MRWRQDQNLSGGNGMSLYDLGGKVAIVTGGAGGIGVGIAKVLAKAGAHVVIADRDEAAANRQSASLREAGGVASAVHLDQADEASIVRACAKIVAERGTPWALVNNAAVQDRQLLVEGTAEEWDRIHGINVRGPFLLMREISRAMIAGGGGGRIVNIASISVRSPGVMGLGAYASSKGALTTLSQNAAFELAQHAITVNTVLPHAVMTDGARHAKGPAPDGPARRLGPLGIAEAEDIGAAVLFFVTPAARLVTNQVLAVDSGFSLT
jgi:NAD(P)-dependent dehydrogenase (short-subunit alcohol dehydrogenase family)